MLIRKPYKKFVVGLDIGTTKICVTSGDITKDGISIKSLNTTQSLGLKKGVVINVDSTINSIRKAINDTERITGRIIDEVIVGISGSHIKCFISSGSTVVSGEEVTIEDVEKAISASADIVLPLDREIIQMVPTDFILDGQGGIKDPIGLSGLRLDVNTLIITGDSKAIQNLIKCCEGAGLEINDIILQSLASAEASLLTQEKEAGIALIDIGGGTTDIAIYKDNWLRHVSVLGIGGNHFTNDLSIGLGLTFQEAERLKIHMGNILPSNQEMNEEIDILEIDGQKRRIPQKYVSEILLPRAEELLELIKKELINVNKQGISICGAVLTGGASLLHAFDRLADVILSMPVRIGYPEVAAKKINPLYGYSGVLKSLQPEFNNPIYSTAIGLIIYGTESFSPLKDENINEDLPLGIKNKMANWFKNTFSKIGG